MRRMEHLATLGLPLFERRVLEVGAGIGDLTEFFLDRGCSVTVTDGRPDNLGVITKRFAGNSRVRIARLDLDEPGDAIPGAHEVVFCYGVLYHLLYPGEALRLLAPLAEDLLLLETVVSRDADDRVELVPESTVRCSQSLRGKGARPTRAWIMRELSGLFPWVYTTKTQPWHAEFPRDWTRPGPVPTTRAVFVASRRELSSPWLTRELPPLHLEPTP
ncbi:MAG: class I SAM-dependent methyltransferase [Phycisphaerae bacterium]|nr:class I SAM-dependent methyltransferase [Phycisphaerae bacterium]